MGGACARTFDVRRDPARVRRSLGDGARRAGGMRVLFCLRGRQARRAVRAYRGGFAGGDGARSWYRSRIWITQFVDVENEAELRDAEALLNEELLRNLKRQREEQKKK